MPEQYRARSYLRAAFACCMLLQVNASNAVAGELMDSKDEIVNTGGHLYHLKCAVCHGPDGKGDGPYANLLNKRPSDLTGLAARNGGEFPLWRVYDTISGNELLPAHGARDMPIWGQELAAEAKSFDMNEKSFVRGRIFSMIAYLLSIQQP